MAPPMWLCARRSDGQALDRERAVLFGHKLQKPPYNVHSIVVLSFSRQIALHVVTDVPVRPIGYLFDSIQINITP